MPGVQTNPYGQIVIALNKDMKDCTPIERLARSLNIQPADIVVMWIITLIVFGIIDLYTHFLVTLLGAIYPAYMTFKTLRTQDVQQARRWLTYWIVFGFLTALDRPLSQLLFILPRYYAIKMALYFFMQYPRFDLATKIYNAVFRQSLRRFRSFSRPGYVPAYSQ